MGSALGRSVRECLPGGGSGHVPLVELGTAEFVHSGTGYRRRQARVGSEGREDKEKTPAQAKRASLKRDMDESIRTQVRIITSRNQQVKRCERQVLRYGRAPGEENRRWAVHHLRQLHRLRARVERQHRTLEVMQTLREEMHMAEEMADAYAMFARYSNEFSKVVAQLREYDVAEMMEELHENMAAIGEMDQAVEAGLAPEALLDAEELSAFEKELAALEAQHAQSSLNDYLYKNTEEDGEGEGVADSGSSTGGRESGGTGRTGRDAETVDEGAAPSMARELASFLSF